MKTINSSCEYILDSDGNGILRHSDGREESMPLFHKKLWDIVPASLTGEYFNWVKKAKDDPTVVNNIYIQEGSDIVDRVKAQIDASGLDWVVLFCWIERK